MSPLATRSLVAVAALTGLAAAFTAGAALTQEQAGSGGSGEDGGTADTLPVAFAGSDLSLASSCADLLDWYVDRGVDRVGPWGWDYPYYYGDMIMNDSVAGAPLASNTESRSAAPLPATSRVTNDGSGTNVQEAGVDEPDIVKTDGRTLFRVQDGNLVTYDLTGADVVRLGSADLNVRGAEILLAGDTVVAIAAEAPPSSENVGASTGTTRVLVFDVSDRAAPALKHTYVYDTDLVTARLHGGTVRLVLQAGLPDLDFVTPGRGDRMDEGEATRENQRVVRDSTIEDWLPTVTADDGAPQQLLDCEDVALPSDGDSLGTIAVVGFDADEPEAPSVSGLAVDTDLAYASVSKLYLATSPYAQSRVDWICLECPLERIAPRWFPGGDDGTSNVYAFDLDGLDTTYAASGEVDGLIRDRWAMDEYDGVLRLAVGPTARTGNFNSILTLPQEGNDLVETGRLDKLGVNEEIRSVRWFDSLAILVTFQQVDPLYAIDLTDHARPTLMGKLKIPGFSGYLHPLGAHRLIGLGEGPGAQGMWGAQAGLFNVTDLTAPRQLDVVSYASGSHANAVDDPRQLTWLPEKRVVLSVVTTWGKVGGATGYVSVLQLGDGELSNRMVEVEYGDEVAAVRLVPLPDGRVVLVTGDDAEFFDF
jgi:hypothetical protein